MPGYWNAHSDRDCEDPLGLNEPRDDERDDPDCAMTEALSRARVLLLQADDEDRLGCEHARLLDLAAVHLRAAGEAELALRVSRWASAMTLGDVPGVLKELDGRVI